MALNNPKSHDSSDSEDDPWEIVDDETTPLALATSSNGVTAAAVPDSYIGDVTDIDAERESHQVEEISDAPNPNRIADESKEDGNESFFSGVSSITGDHHTISDVEEGEDVDALVDEVQKEVPTGTLLDLPGKLLGHRDEKLEETAGEEGEEIEAYYDNKLGHWVFCRDGPAGVTKPLVPKAEDPVTPGASGTESTEKKGDEKSVISDIGESPSNMGPDNEASATPATPSAEDSPENMNEEKSESSDLVNSLLNMGFEKDQITKAVKDLREAGTIEIDEDSVIASMMGETNNNNHRTTTWDFVESTARGFEEQHELRRRTQSFTRNIGLSARELWSTIEEESDRFRSNLQTTCEEADVRARSARERTARAATHVKYAASSAKDSVCRANEEYGITEKVADAAVVGGATLLLLGSPRAGAGVIAVAGATLAAGEVMKQSSARSGSTHTRDYGLGEGVHLD
mmetsp:Transcript_31730/g.60591  ORF Transcript_31730/g.60591 Transcript_31730/m.60591 type:complete len:459 (-) Transcript_31730:509-1885(-)